MLFYALFGLAFFGTLAAGRGGVRQAVAVGWLGTAFLLPFWVQIGLGSLLLDLRTASAAAVVIVAAARPPPDVGKLSIADGLVAVVVLSQLVSLHLNGGIRPLSLPEILRKWVAPYLMGRLLLADAADVWAVTGGLSKVVVGLSALAVFECAVQINPVNTALGRTFGLLEAGEGYRWGLKRAHVTFDHPIFFGMALVLVLPWALEASRQAKGGAGPRWRRLVPAAVAAALFATVSRGPQLAGMATAGVYFFFRVPAVRVPLLVLAVGGGLGAKVFKDELVDLLAVVAGEKKAPGEARIIVIDGEEYEYTGTNHRVLLFVVYDKPIREAGWFGFGAEMRGVELDEALAQRFASIDNHYLRHHLQFGRAGLGSFLILALGTILTTARLAFRRGHPLAPLAGGLCGALAAVAFLLISVWFSPDFAGIWLFTAGVAGRLPYLPVPAAGDSQRPPPKPLLPRFVPRPAPPHAPVRPLPPEPAHAFRRPGPPAGR